MRMRDLAPFLDAKAVTFWLVSMIKRRCGNGAWQSGKSPEDSGQKAPKGQAEKLPVETTVASGECDRQKTAPVCRALLSPVSRRGAQPGCGICFGGFFRGGDQFRAGGQ